MELAAQLAGRIRRWIQAHPLQPQGSIRPEFSTRPGASRRPRPDFLLRDVSGTSWFVRWPNGSTKWESDGSLRARGIAVPAAPIFDAELDEEPDYDDAA